MPAPPVSLPPDAVTPAEARLRQVSEPPATGGAPGRCGRSSPSTPAVGEAGAQAVVRPEASVARNWTIVVPAAVTETSVPVLTADQVLPPLVDVRYW